MSNEDDINATAITKKRWRGINGLTALAIIVGSFLCSGFLYLFMMMEQEEEAIDLVVGLIEEYVEENQGAWPQSWDDLEELPQ